METIIGVLGGEWTGERTEAVAAAVRHLSAVDLGGGEYAYHAEETGQWYRVRDFELAELGASLLLGEADAYSHWCCGCGEEISDLDHDTLDEVANASDAQVSYRCQCGEWSGQRCESTGPRERLVRVKFVRDSDKGSATASGTYTRGAYATTVYVDPACAEQMRHRWEDGEQTDEEDEFVRVIGPAY